MCGRFGLAEPEFSETRFDAQPLPEVQPLLLPRFNIAPSQEVLTVARSSRLDGARALKAMVWGLTAEWAVNDRKKPRPINLKAETLLDRPYYERLISKRRCLIPADGFYEWKRGTKQPWNIGLRGGAMFAFAGVWDACKVANGWLVSCAILTTTPNDLLADIHDRMPVILTRAAEEVWLAEDATAADLLPCLTAHPAEAMERYPVVLLVGDVKHEGPELRQPAAAVSEQQTFAWR